MKRSTANSKSKKEKSKKTSNNSDEKLEKEQETQEEIQEQELIQLMLSRSQEIDESEDLDLMSPSDFIATINNSYVLRKQTGRSRLKFHPKKVTIKNYW